MIIITWYLHDHNHESYDCDDCDIGNNVHDNPDNADFENDLGDHIWWEGGKL